VVEDGATTKVGVIDVNPPGLTEKVGLDKLDALFAVIVAVLPAQIDELFANNPQLVEPVPPI
jgi:hypothetical protein